MRILHYALGFPPYRSGGLTKYCVDLMIRQAQEGHKVVMMWPGRFSLTGHFVRFKKSRKNVWYGKESVKFDSIEVINPLPVPLDEGILDVNRFIKKCPNERVFVEILKDISPDVIHIHTFMGLHREFLKVAKKMGIRLVFTSHDYFGICPKVTLFKEGKVCSGDCSQCGVCNQGALDIKKIKVLQSGIYRGLKETSIVKKMRKIHRQKFFKQDAGSETLRIDHKQQSSDEFYKDVNIEVNEEFGKEILEEEKRRYEKLRKYYMSMFQLIDVIHFNSSVTESVYRKFLPENIKGKVVNISHNDVKDNRKLKDFDHKVLQITYLAPAKAFKGYEIMKQALDEIWIAGNRNFHLTMYNEAQINVPYATVNERFEYSALEKIFDNTDVLIMPSVWYETFGFTVLEALSYGVPVVVTDNVGAKDLIKQSDYGMVIQPTKEGIRASVESLIKDRKILKQFNRKIVEEMDIDSVINSSKEIEKMYEE